MSKEYKQQQHHHRTTTTTTTTTFFPRLCRASTQDIKLVILPNLSGDPSSPRVSCTGNVKRSRKVTGFPTPPPKFTTSTPAGAAASTTPTGRRPTHNSTYSNLRATPIQQPRFVRSKSASRTPLTAITAGGPTVCGCRRGSILNSNHSSVRAGSTQPNPSPRTPPSADTHSAADITPSIHAPERGINLNSNYSTLKACSVSRATFNMSKTGSWIVLNTTAIAAAGKSNVSHSKVKSLCSGKNIIGPATGISSRNREMKTVNVRRRPEFAEEIGRSYDVEQDPPLPVVKKVKQPGFDREEVNLWKRRSSKSGIELTNLKIQQIHLNNNHYHTTTTVSFFDDRG